MKLFRISKRARKVREAIVHEALLLVAHAPNIHYDQRRPIDYSYQYKMTAPPGWRADCSGSTAAIYRTAGAPDPTGEGFNGYGNTDTILATLDAISPRQARRGDLVLFHVGADGKHVCVLLESPRWHRDPWCESHGGEYGPLRVPLSTEVTYHAGETVTYLRGVPVHY